MNNFWFDKGFDGVNDDFFDDVIKYLDFPLEDVEGTDSGSGGVIKDFHLPIDDVEQNNCGGSGCGSGEEWDCNFQNLEPPPANVLASMSSGFGGDFFSDCLVKSLSISCDGSRQLNQWSSTSEASSGRSVTPNSESANVKGSIGFQTSSPVSVLESSSTRSAANPAFINPQPGFLVKRGRSKHRRASAFNLHFTLPFTSSTSSTSRGSNFSVGSESESESHLTEAKKRLKKKKNLTWLSGFNDTKRSPSEQPTEVRKCLHCEVTKTPQWREGPMGPKTLCNACGVRFRSGRLLPEYRPAASPTFVPAVHSNSHKKVVEMRKKANLSVTPESIIDYLRSSLENQLLSPEKSSTAGFWWHRDYRRIETGLEIGHCKVFLDSEDVGRTLDLSVLGSYEELYRRLGNMFGIERLEILGHVLYIDATGAVKRTGDEPFSAFMKTAKKINKRMNSSNEIAGR
ncbi:Detected protein of unknown function [Hibiscus syriacus]|uniref:GATA-type domain-containing protein n=1 Tax=Hibiscus syriacus TaxID=106335 RepID=A0A6A2ZP57_HIBSY|nr:Detected protein of unknown function [Hibiscus syriacus]